MPESVGESFRIGEASAFFRINILSELFGCQPEILKTGVVADIADSVEWLVAAAGNSTKKVHDKLIFYCQTAIKKLMI